MNRPPDNPVTRMEILDAIDTAFTSKPTSKAHILATAEDSRARAELVALLRDLPDRSFYDVRELWNYLPDVPVEV